MSGLKPVSDEETLIKKAQLKRDQVEHIGDDVTKLKATVKRINAKISQKKGQIERLLREITELEETVSHVNDECYQIKDKKWKS